MKSFLTQRHWIAVLKYTIVELLIVPDSIFFFFIIDTKHQSLGAKIYVVFSYDCPFHTLLQCRQIDHTFDRFNSIESIILTRNAAENHQSIDKY